MTWLNDSIMATRGVAGGQAGATHHLTEEMQGTFHYTIGPYSDPVLTIAPGDRVIVDTRDAFEGAIKTEADLPSAKLTMPFVNPQNGPIMVEGAEIGDTIAVYIDSMHPRGADSDGKFHGACAMIPEFGALTGTALTATLNEPLPELVRVVEVDEESVYWSDRVTLPYRPHIGTLSTSPQIDSINSLTPDSHGGNMDLPDMGPGTVTYLPVRSPGARLFIGDAHACQGDGEVCGTAIEYQSTTTIQVDLIKGWTIDWPRLETDEVIMSIGSARPLEDATRIAYRNLILWMEAEYGYDRWDAYMMLSQCGRVRLGNFVDPNYTVGAAISKTYLQD
ncbi:MAG: acetamidase/formamidase family protein [Acidimicrobiales bacterium]